MKQHLYDDGKYIHLCKGERMDERNADTYLVWTLCGTDVPANKSFTGAESATCPKCKP